jgi:hypothetical protein
VRTVTVVVLVAAALLAPATAMASVLVVGDSLGLGTDGSLRSALPGTTITADDRNGRPSPEGVSVLRDRLRPDHDTVVFDLGTNDGPGGVDVTARSLAAARDLAGGRCLVVATLNHPPVGGTSIDGQNTMIRRFVLDTPNAVLVDWHDAASSTPGALGSDGVHATSAGYALRGLLFADAITGCLADGGGGAGGRGVAPGTPASSTDRPAGAGRPKPKPRPSLAEQALAQLAESLTADKGPLEMVAKASTAFAAAAGLASTAMTPRGPEPVLGAD